MNIRTQGTQKEAQIINIDDVKKPTMHYKVDYDSTHPEQTIRSFVADIKGMVSKYEWNRDRIIEIEKEFTDLEHYIEIAPFQNVPCGYKLYRKIAELRRERRACKNENDLLQPVYEYFHATAVLDKLSICQGEVAKADSAVKSRCYQVRTGVLDDYILDEHPDIHVGLNLLTGETALCKEVASI